MTGNLSQSAGEMTDILDIEPVLAGSAAWWIRAGLWALAVAMVAVLVWVLYRYIRKRRASCVLELSPFERALKELEDLRKSRHYAQREWAPYYFRLSETFKRFVSGHCAVDILDKTTDEILRLKAEFARIADSADWERVKAFLTRGDRAKFAKADATPAEAAEDFDFVEKFVRKAKPAAAVAPATGT